MSDFMSKRERGYFGWHTGVVVDNSDDSCVEGLVRVFPAFSIFLPLFTDTTRRSYRNKNYTEKNYKQNISTL